MIDSEELIHTDFLRKAQSEIKKRTKLMAFDLAYGEITDIQEYKYACGVIRGMNDAYEILVQLSKEYKEEEFNNG